VTPSTPALVTGILVLGAGTYALRVAGPLLGERLSPSPAARRLLERAAVVLLTALTALAALTQDGGLAGAARPAGVLVAGALAWRRAPFLVIVLSAAATTAALRLLGTP